VPVTRRSWVSRNAANGAGHARRLPNWRREELLTTLWQVPTTLVCGAVVLFIVTYELDVAASHHHVGLPSWIHTLSPSDAREVVSAVAAAVITVVGVVFSVTILALTLASQQFGPRMMRNFVRDIGNQVTLGVWVATFVYSVLTLGSISANGHQTFVPYISITVTEVLLMADVVVLIYFIHHIAKSIQLPEVVASIASDLLRAIDAEFPPDVEIAPQPLPNHSARPSLPDPAARPLPELLGPAVNDTFTALTCIDWLSAGLCRISIRTLAEGVYRDRLGRIRLIESDPSYARMVNRAIDKIRQAGGGMPAVVIRLMDSITHVVECTTSRYQVVVLRRQAEMVLRAADEEIAEPNDLAQVRERYDYLVSISEEREATFIEKGHASPPRQR
jgi:uncharacterized membrane protein